MSVSKPLPGELFASEYTIDPCPTHPVEPALFAVKIEWRGEDRWRVTHMSHVYGADGTFEYEGSNHREDENYMATHRFDLDTAVELARRIAPTVKVGRMTFQDWKDWWNDHASTPEERVQ